MNFIVSASPNNCNCILSQNVKIILTTKCHAHMNLMLCCKPKSNEERTPLEIFVRKRLPIFWICGPPGVGKSTLANLFAQSSDFKLVKCSQLIAEEQSRGNFRGRLLNDLTSSGKKDVPGEIIVELIREAILGNSESPGFIIDGFPRVLYDAKLFEKQICRVTIIVYVTVKLEDLIQRRMVANRSLTERFVVEEHRRQSKICEEINRKYRRNTIKIHTNIDPKQTCNLLLETLNEYWEYNFTLYK